MRVLTIAAAARELEISEWRVKQFIEDGSLEVLGIDKDLPGRPRLVCYDDVVMIGRRLRLGRVDRERRTILFVESGEESHRLADLLVAGQLHVKRAPNLLGALGEHESDLDDPIIVMEPPRGSAEQNLLRALDKKIRIVFVDYDTIGIEVDDVVPAGRFDYDEPRRIAQRLWELVDERE